MHGARHALSTAGCSALCPHRNRVEGQMRWAVASLGRPQTQLSPPDCAPPPNACYALVLFIVSIYLRNLNKGCKTNTPHNPICAVTIVSGTLLCVCPLLYWLFGVSVLFERRVQTIFFTTKSFTGHLTYQ